MKNLIYAMAIGLCLFACSQNDLLSDDKSSLESISVSDLPAKATLYVSDNYPDASVSSAAKVSNSAAKYVARLNTNELLAFTNQGDFIGDGTKYCHGDSTHTGSHHPPMNGSAGPKDHHGEGQHGTDVPLTSLSATIAAYVSANYSDYTLLHAEKDSICHDGVVTKVVVAKDELHIKLYFDSSDNFLMSGKRIPYSETAQAVKDYVLQTYAQYTAHQGAIELTVAAGGKEYFVFLHMNGQNRSDNKLILRLKEDGTLVCAN